MNELIFGTGIAHTILLFALVIATGIYLGRFKVKGVSIGSTWILFVGILLSHFGFRADPHILSFMKDFGLILFVFSIGLQVGPGFFHTFRTGGLKMNLLAFLMVILAVGVTLSIHFITGEDLRIMTGVMSGAVTNTPGLGAAQQTLSDAMSASGISQAVVADSTSSIASAYAVAYPLGVLGVIFLLIFFKAIFKVDIDKEKEALDNEGNEGGNAIRASYQVCNPALFGMTVASLIKDDGDRFVISRISHGGVVETPGPATVLNEGDNVLVITSQAHEEAVKILFGKELEIPFSEWTAKKSSPVARKITITRSGLTGKKLRELNVRSLYGVTVTRVIRAGVELVANPNLYLQMGDTLLVVGDEEGIDKVARLFGNKASRLSHPNLVPIFFGIVIGVIFGSIPISFPGVPQPVKLGLAGGPLIISILLGYFGPKMKITTYTTVSANMMLREIGISFFLAAVGLGAGANFISAIVNGGYWWILYGFLITVVPIIVTVLVARLALKLNFYQICGLIAGSTTNPPVLAFAQGAYGTDYTSVNYATVYPLSMFMRVLAAQLLILFTL
ncbi:MAG: putative transporter [Candidatus Cryptobacteroides sp.]|nr:putative transporter [Bacteroidales bacterium]MDY3226590.1 putative transporter [Candidatus Cryptobacteroides sp.]MDD7083066.1 putative transporter [Bacteroidales bacterium]MDD7118833.1 putative transporter [Bacteroidales bacterium]MDY4571684.1 putative transporter [Candidatus Cryptobacteroides sp.]